jgi:hypothetical protein
MNSSDKIMADRAEERRKLKAIKFAIAAMHEALEYLDGYADADHNGSTFVPNDAMKLSLELQEAVAALLSVGDK